MALLRRCCCFRILSLLLGCFRGRWFLEFTLGGDGNEGSSWKPALVKSGIMYLLYVCMNLVFFGYVVG